MMYMTTLQVLGWLIYLVSLGAVIRKLPLVRLRDNKKVQHLVFGAAASVFFLWMFRVGIYPGLEVHFLWLTALTLVLGFRWAMVSGALSLLGVTVAGQESWAMLGINGVLGVSVPILLSYLVYNFTFHKLPRHFLVYVFLCAFLPGALMIAVKMGLIGGYYYLDDALPWQVIWDNYLVLIPLMLFSEGMLNGMTMILLILYKPTWVYTFYDKFYLNK